MRNVYALPRGDRRQLIIAQIPRLPSSTAAAAPRQLLLNEGE
jgi:hypothetical protein